MNIKQAKEYIRNTVDLYLKKDGFGEYRIPVVRQRPIFLLGAPDTDTLSGRDTLCWNNKILF